MRLPGCLSVPILVLLLAGLVVLAVSPGLILKRAREDVRDVPLASWESPYPTNEPSRAEAPKASPKFPSDRMSAEEAPDFEPDPRWVPSGALAGGKGISRVVTLPTRSGSGFRLTIEYENEHLLEVRDPKPDSFQQPLAYDNYRTNRPTGLVRVEGLEESEGERLAFAVRWRSGKGETYLIQSHDSRARSDERICPWLRERRKSHPEPGRRWPLLSDAAALLCGARRVGNGVYDLRATIDFTANLAADPKKALPPAEALPPYRGSPAEAPPRPPPPAEAPVANAGDARPWLLIATLYSGRSGTSPTVRIETRVGDLVIDDLEGDGAGPKLRRFEPYDQLTGRFIVQGTAPGESGQPHGVALGAMWLDQQVAVRMLKSQGLPNRPYLCAQPAIDFDEQLLRSPDVDTLATLLCASQFFPDGEYDLSALPQFGVSGAGTP